MGVVFLLEALFAGCVQFRAGGADDVVAAVGGGVVGWFVFAHEGYCYGGGDAA